MTLLKHVGMNFFVYECKKILQPDVLGVINHLIIATGVCLQRIKVNTGREFISKVLDEWVFENNMGRPLKTPKIE